ncbi:MAG: hypothetical protein KY466_06605 [Gemmatimonadetes bacterium]|nr:hypothetical protein [Gemmatimonadota bacterium]
MGIRFVDSILSLLTSLAVVFSAYFVGHALSSDHAGWAWITAAALIVLGAGLGFLTVRRIRDFAARRDSAVHHTHAHH